MSTALIMYLALQGCQQLISTSIVTLVNLLFKKKKKLNGADQPRDERHWELGGLVQRGAAACLHP